MTEPQKYTFDQAFDGGAQNRFDIEVARLKAEIETTRRQSHAAGVEEGRTQMRGEIDAATHALVTQMINGAEKLFAQHAALKADLTHDMGRLSFLIADRLVSGFQAAFSEAQVDALVRDCLDAVAVEADLRISVSESLQPVVEEKILAGLAGRPAGGSIKVIADPALSEQDYTIAWATGKIERRQQEITEQVEALVSQFLGVESAGDQHAAPDTAQSGRESE